MRTVILLCILMMTAVSVICVGQSQQGGSGDVRMQDLIAGLSAQNIPQRRAAFKQILSQRAEILQSLLKIAKTKKEKYQRFDERELAVQLLGEMRAPEAVDTLINEITFNPPAVYEEPSPVTPYPCAEALVKIGDPAVRGLLERVEEKPNKDILTLHAAIIQLVEGSWEVGALKIKKALKGSVGGRREYLEALLETYNRQRFVPE